MPLQRDRLHARTGGEAATPVAGRVQRLLQLRWRHKFLWNLRAAWLLLEEVSAAGEDCVGSIPKAERRLA